MLVNKKCVLLSMANDHIKMEEGHWRLLGLGAALENCTSVSHVTALGHAGDGFILTSGIEGAASGSVWIPEFTEKGCRGQREAAGAHLGPQQLRVAGLCSVRQSQM